MLLEKGSYRPMTGFWLKQGVNYLVALNFPRQELKRAQDHAWHKALRRLEAMLGLVTCLGREAGPHWS